MPHYQCPAEVLRKSLSQLKQEERQRLQMACLWLQEQQFNYAVIGGLAVCQYAAKARPLTPDLDILVEDLDLVKEVLIHQNIYQEALVGQNGIEIGLHIPVLNLDVLASEFMPDPIRCNDKIEAVLLWESKIKFIDIHSLLLTKLHSARNHDFEDVQLLVTHPTLKIKILIEIGETYPAWKEELQSVFWQLERREM
jgi:predicted nucleotidyltransferase